MSHQIIYLGRVKSVCDEFNGNRIRVKIPLDGQKEPEEGWPYAFPLLPKTIQTMPKVGEIVLIILANPKKRESTRFYIGPLISQPQKMYMDEAQLKDDPGSLLPMTTVSPLETTNHFVETFGSFPTVEEVALIGRKSEDIILKDDEINIRCGVRNEADGNENKSLIGNVLFNSVSPTYIQLKHRRNGETGKQNLINLVGGKINLISNDDAKKITDSMRNYNNVNVCGKEMINGLYHRDEMNNEIANSYYGSGVTGSFTSFDDKTLRLYYGNKDQKSQYDEMEYDELLVQLHRLPYGDVLVKILNIIKKAILTHKHSWAQEPPTTENVPELIQLMTWGTGSDPSNAPDLENLLLSDTVRIS